MLILRATIPRFQRLTGLQSVYLVSIHSFGRICGPFLLADSNFNCSWTYDLGGRHVGIVERARRSPRHRPFQTQLTRGLYLVRKYMYIINKSVKMSER